MKRHAGAALGAMVAAVVACGGASGGDGGSDGGSDGGVDAGPSFKLSGVPDCGTPGDAGTAADLFAAVLSTTGCSALGCHGAGAGFVLFQFGDGPGFRSAVVNQKSAQVASMNRITPANIHQSYLIYKLMDQHLDAGFSGAGSRMPQGGPYLSDAELCRVIDWVNAGAP